MADHPDARSGGSAAGSDPGAGEVRPARLDTAALLERSETYLSRAHRMARAQYLAAKSTQRSHNRFGVPVVVLTAVVSTSIFATISSSPATGWVLAAGSVSAAASVLAALQTFFGFATRAQQHKLAGARYSSTAREIDLLCLRLQFGHVSASEAIERLTEILASLNEIDQESPDVSDRIYDRARREELRDQ